MFTLNQEVTVRGQTGKVSRLNDDGTCSVCYRTAEGARFLHRVSEDELPKEETLELESVENKC